MKKWIFVLIVVTISCLTNDLYAIGKSRAAAIIEASLLQEPIRKNAAQHLNGWATYGDSQYTEISPLVLQKDVRTQISINRLGTGAEPNIETYKGKLVDTWLVRSLYCTRACRRSRVLRE